MALTCLLPINGVQIRGLLSGALCQRFAELVDQHSIRLGRVIVFGACFGIRFVDHTSARATVLVAATPVIAVYPNEGDFRVLRKSIGWRDWDARTRLPDIVFSIRQPVFISIEIHLCWCFPESSTRH